MSALLTVGALAQDPATTSAPVDGYASLRAEISPTRPIYSPGEPALLRCTIFNPTDEAVDLPAEKLEEGRISLPPGLLFGRGEPALWLAWENEKPTAVKGPAIGDGSGQLRLDARSSLGSEIDLRTYVKSLRYSGEYSLEWRPFGDRGPSATTRFRVEARKSVVLHTDYGKMTFILNYEKAPRNVEAFLELVRTKAYDGAGFHRVISGYLIQGGSPDGTPHGARADGKTTPAEFQDSVFDMGTLAMARKPRDPNSASAQFFITLARLPELDGKYSVVGQARDEESLRTLRQISDQAVDKDDKPLRQVVIRFATLMDAESNPVEHVEISRP